MTLIGALIAAAYLLLILPALTSFPALVVALAPFYLFCGLLLAQPRAVPMVLPVIFGANGLLSVSNQMTYDFEAFTNNALGYVVGIGWGVVALALLRPFGREVAATRLIRGMLRDLARLAAAAVPEKPSSFQSRTFDRINALLAQLDPDMPNYRQRVQGSFAALRVGLNVLVLNRERPNLPAALLPAIDRALVALSAALRATASGRRAEPPGPLLKAARLQVLSVEDDRPTVADALYGIESTIEQHRDFFLPEDRVSSRPVAEAVAT
jgi:uncharacterized membrane protein YccC